MRFKATGGDKLTPPADHTITSLFLSQLPDGTTQDQVRALVPEELQESVKSVVLVSASKCGFVNLVDRPSAEAVAKAWSKTGVQVEGAGFPSKAQWGRSKTKAAAVAA